MKTLEELEEAAIDVMIRFRTDIEGLGWVDPKVPWDEDNLDRPHASLNPLVNEFCSAVDALIEAQKEKK